MLQEINERIAELKSKLRQKRLYEDRKITLEKEREEAIKQRNLLAQRLQEEQKDVERLTSISLGALYYTLIGKKEEKLSQEQTEMLQAKLRYDEAADTVTDLDTELEEMNNQLSVLRYIDTEVTEALNQKIKIIRQGFPSLAAELDELLDHETELQADVKELKEAVYAGRSVLKLLGEAEDQLHSAKNWGTYDMMGGGIISTSIKHDRINQARTAIHAAQRSLRHFQKELKDVQRDLNIQIHMGELLTFADYFFDGFITDWMVQGRIKDSLSEVQSKRSHIGRIVSELDKKLQKNSIDLQQIVQRRSALIEQA